MSREIRRQNASLLQKRRKTVHASTQGKDVRIGSLQLIVHQDSAVYFQASLQRQLDIWPETHRDHHKISLRYPTVCEAHGSYAAIAKHCVNLAHRDFASALSQRATDFPRQPIADHDGTGPC
jgi:hypothetical protein